MSILHRGMRKNNSRKKHVPEQMKAQRRADALERQAKYDSLSLNEKIKRSTPGTKQWKKLVEKLPVVCPAVASVEAKVRDVKGMT